MQSGVGLLKCVCVRVCICVLGPMIKGMKESDVFFTLL